MLSILVNLANAIGRQKFALFEITKEFGCHNHFSMPTWTSKLRNMLI